VGTQRLVRDDGTQRVGHDHPGVRGDDPREPLLGAVADGVLRVQVAADLPYQPDRRLGRRPAEPLRLLQPAQRRLHHALAAVGGLLGAFRDRLEELPLERVVHVTGLQVGDVRELVVAVGALALAAVAVAVEHGGDPLGRRHGERGVGQGGAQGVVPVGEGGLPVLVLVSDAVTHHHVRHASPS
jgi:hypothetical protein